MNYALELKNVSKRYGGFTLDIVHLCLERGCIMGLIGENGAGKTTIIKSILGLIQPDRGEITVLGKNNARELGLMREHLGVVMDESGYPEEMRLRDVALVLKNIYRTWDAGRFSAYLKQFGLPEGKRVKELSRGMKMKLSIAASLSHDSQLLILDEATSGLDPIVRDEMLDIFLEFIQDENKAVLLSSHILSDLEKACDYITFVHRGRIVFSEPKDELTERYAIVRCSASDFERINPASVVGARKNAFGVEALVLKEAARPFSASHRAGIEDIMLYYVKEGGK